MFLKFCSSQLMLAKCIVPHSEFQLRKRIWQMLSKNGAGSQLLLSFIHQFFSGKVKAKWQGWTTRWLQCQFAAARIAVTSAWHSHARWVNALNVQAPWGVLFAHPSFALFGCLRMFSHVESGQGQTLGCPGTECLPTFGPTATLLTMRCNNELQKDVHAWSSTCHLKVG